MRSTDHFQWIKLACVLGLAGLMAGAQTVAPPGSRPASAAPPPAAASPLDSLFAQLIQQGASDAMVMVDAEFDPPVSPLGNSAIYRVVVTAQQEACVMPDKLPVPPGLELTASGEGMSYSAVNQSIQYRTTFNYRVKAKETGAYTMPSFTLQANGKPVSVPAKSITIVPPGAGPAPARLIGELPPGDIYIGQSVALRLLIPDLGNEGLMAITQSKAEGDAFIFEKLAGRQRKEVRNIEGRMVPVLIDEILAIPIKEGRHPVTLHAFVIGTRKPDPRMISLPSYYPLLDSDPLEVPVKHLPAEGELPGFTGLIGAFQVDPPTLSTNQVRAGDPIAMVVTVRGHGNLPRLVPPKPAPTPDWQIFPPAPDSSPPTIIQLRGTNVFAYPLIPLRQSIQATPAIPFSYFDPQQKRYVDITIPPVPIRVLPPNEVIAQPRKGMKADALAETGLPPRGIAKGAAPASHAPLHPPRTHRVVPLQERPWFLALQVLLGAGLAGLWTWDRRRHYLALHPEILRKRRARRGLRRERRHLRRAAARKDAAGFVRASVNALREACAPHAAAQPEALVCADVLHELAPAERDGEAGRMVRKLFSLADAATFRNKAPELPVLLSHQPQLEQLLEGLRRRL